MSNPEGSRRGDALRHRCCRRSNIGLNLRFVEVKVWAVFDEELKRQFG